MWWASDESRYMFTARKCAPIVPCDLTRSGLVNFSPLWIDILVALRWLATMEHMWHRQVRLYRQSLWFLTCLRCAAFLYLHVRLAYWLPRVCLFLAGRGDEACRWTIPLLTDQNVGHNHRQQHWKCYSSLTIVYFETGCRKLSKIGLCRAQATYLSFRLLYENGRRRMFLWLLPHYCDRALKHFKALHCETLCMIYVTPTLDNKMRSLRGLLPFIMSCACWCVRQIKWDVQTLNYRAFSGTQAVDLLTREKGHYPLECWPEFMLPVISCR